MTIEELLKQSKMDLSELAEGTAAFDITVSGEEDCKDFLEWFSEGAVASGVCTWLAPEDEDFEDEDEELEFYNNVTVTDCSATVLLNMERREIRHAYLHLNAIYDGTADTVEVECDGYEVYFQEEEKELLIARVIDAECRRIPEQLTADTCEDEIRRLFLCDAAERFVNDLAAQLTASVQQSGAAAPVRVGRIFAENEAPMGDKNSAYLYLEVSPENNRKFDKIYDFCMSDPRLNDGTFAGNRQFCLRKGTNGERKIGFLALTGSDIRPCYHRTTKTLDSLLKLTAKKAARSRIKAVEPCLLAEEHYQLKRSQEQEVCTRSFSNLHCQGCSYKVGGLFSKYQSCDCQRYLCVRAADT